MSDNYGFDFDNDDKVSFEESFLTYKIERDTARNNSLYDALSRRSAAKKSSGTYTPVTGSNATPSKDVHNASDNVDSKSSDFSSSTSKDSTHVNPTVFIVIAVITLILIIGVIAAGNIGNKKHVPDVNRYNSVIRLIQDGEYREAINRIKFLNENDFNDLKALKNYAWTLYHYERKNYVETYNHLEMCIDAIRLHPEFDSPDTLMEEIKPLAEKQREATLKEIEELNRQIAEQNAKKQQTTTAKKKSDYSYSSDEYNVIDYYSAEDFYDDHYDDFFDYYDAEDYYNDHGGF